MVNAHMSMYGRNICLSFPKMDLKFKQVHQHFILLQANKCNLCLKVICQFLKFNDLIVCFSCEASWRVLVTWQPFLCQCNPAHILGNVWLKKSNVHANTSTFKHKYMHIWTQTHFLKHKHTFIYNTGTRSCVSHTIKTELAPSFTSQ